MNTGKRKKRKTSTASGKRKRSGNSQQQKVQKTSSRANKKTSERNADGIDTVNIVSNRRQRSAIASYSQLHNGEYGSETESEPDYDGEYESDDYDDEEQSHRDYCMKCHKHGELFMCEGEDCAGMSAVQHVLVSLLAPALMLQFHLIGQTTIIVHIVKRRIIMNLMIQSVNDQSKETLSICSTWL